MADMGEQVAVEVLQEFADAWNRHDVDALMTFMADDCVFEASAGPDVSGTRYVGREAVRAGFAEVWVTFPDAHWGDARHFVCGREGSRNGRSPEHARTARASKFMVAICLRFEAARLR